MTTLDEKCRLALAFPASRPAIEFEKHWVSWGEDKQGSVGRALPGVKLRVTDPQSGSTLPAGGEAPSAAEVEAHLRQHVPATHIPVVWHFTAALPRTPSMKVDQPAVRRLLENASKQ